MLNKLIKPILVTLLLTLSACSDTKDNKKENSNTTQTTKKKVFDKPPYDDRLDIHDDVRMWYKTDELTESAYNIGLVYHQEIKDLGWAEFWYKRAIELDEKNLDARKNLAIIYKIQSKFDTAILLYEENIKYGDNSVILNLAILYEDINNYDFAVKWYKIAIERENRSIKELISFISG